MARILNENQIDFATDDEMASALIALISAASVQQLELAFEKLDEMDLATVVATSVKAQETR